MSAQGKNLTVKEGAALLGISASGMYYLVRTGKVPARRYHARGEIILDVDDLIGYAYTREDIYSDAEITRIENVQHA